MNAAQLLRSLLSHRIALGVVAVLAVLAGVAGWMSVSPLYRSATMLVVIPPGAGDPDAMKNPLINLNFEVTQLALVVGTALQGEGGKQAAVDAGGTGEFTVETTYGTSANEQLTPQLNISADASNPESARRSADALVAYAGGILNKVQRDAGVPLENDAKLVSAIEPQAGKNVPANRARRAGACGVGTIFAGLVLIMLFDALLEWRRGRNAGTQQTGSDDDDGRASKPAYTGRAAEGHPLTRRTRGPHESNRARHSAIPGADADPAAITAANPPSMYPPRMPFRPGPS